MASRWAFRRSSLKDGDPKLLFRLNGDIVFTKDYVKHTLFTKKPYGHGTQGIITNIHHGPLGKSRTWTCVYRRANSCVKCRSITFLA